MVTTSALHTTDHPTNVLLHNNIAQFAAAKVFSTLSKAHTLTPDQLKVHLQKHYTYAKVEYNTIKKRLRTLHQWNTMQGEKLFPNIIWLPSRSAEPDPTHRRFWNRIWPKDDPFWQSHFPGNRYGCKCSWASTHQPPTDNSDLPLPKKIVGLDENPALTQRIFSLSHPYFLNTPPHLLKLASLHLPDKLAYIKSAADGPSIYTHYLHYTSHEYQANLLIAQRLAAHFNEDVYLLPTISAKEPRLRQRFFAHNLLHNPSANPDARIGNQFFEFKKSSAKNLSKNLLQALRSSPSVAIYLTEYLPYSSLSTLIRRSVLSRKIPYQKICFIFDNQILIFTP
ncbi:hypothetical protein JCM31826_01420 [Thermaurantimonas aggregans]|uniref:Phage head morphogenesis domain-containing protein n=1 Tax=Thermaurantimonas aggregans TaxID=2173829 RepID=A0A401XI13_9FLAO|nr:hypothetical protein [Thermaurantimonas aggregans]GCD76660.1 hypothetical protein JCM31826_01420 [Thermaurantimonas aggregans]